MVLKNSYPCPGMAGSALFTTFVLPVKRGNSMRLLFLQFPRDCCGAEQHSRFVKIVVL